MWLINTSTRALEEFSNETTAPPYAILSHTWGKEEVTFADMQTARNDAAVRSKHGYCKIDFVCTLAPARSLRYAWVDTCCIDKSSSAELSEAINSMYNPYARARVCFVLLTDMPRSNPSLLDSAFDRAAFVSCRWFLRGWTLQELLAPQSLEFYDELHHCFGTLQSVLDAVHEATKIDLPVLKKSTPLAQVSVAKRMSWAANRETTRVEDQAYSMLGIFGISMPMLYGEGSKAFIRLQEEILKSSTDHSLFAWESGEDWSQTAKLLAPSPKNFANGNSVVSFSGSAHNRAYRITNGGLEITLPLIYPWAGQQHLGLALLDCGSESNDATVFALPLSIPNVPSHSLTSSDKLEPLRCSIFATGKLGSHDWGGSDERLVTHKLLAQSDAAVVRPLLICHSLQPDIPLSCSFWFRLVDNTRFSSLKRRCKMRLLGGPTRWHEEDMLMTFSSDATAQTAGLEFYDRGARIMIAVGVKRTTSGMVPNMLSSSIWDRDPGDVGFLEQWRQQIRANDDSVHTGLANRFRFSGSWPISERPNIHLTVESNLRQLPRTRLVEVTMRLSTDLRPDVSSHSEVLCPRPVQQVGELFLAEGGFHNTSILDMHQSRDALWRLRRERGAHGSLYKGIRWLEEPMPSESQGWIDWARKEGIVATQEQHWQDDASWLPNFMVPTASVPGARYAEYEQLLEQHKCMALKAILSSRVRARKITPRQRQSVVPSESEVELAESVWHTKHPALRVSKVDVTNLAAALREKIPQPTYTHLSVQELAWAKAHHGLKPLQDSSVVELAECLREKLLLCSRCPSAWSSDDREEKHSMWCLEHQQKLRGNLLTGTMPSQWTPFVSSPYPVINASALSLHGQRYLLVSAPFVGTESSLALVEGFLSVTRRAETRTATRKSNIRPNQHEINTARTLQQSRTTNAPCAGVDEYLAVAELALALREKISVEHDETGALVSPVWQDDVFLMRFIKDRFCWLTVGLFGIVIGSRCKLLTRLWHLRSPFRLLW